MSGQLAASIAQVEANAADAAEIEVRRQAAERQSHHLATRLRIEAAAHMELSGEFEQLQIRMGTFAAELADVRAQNDILQRELLAERDRTAALEEANSSLREDGGRQRDELARVETQLAVQRSEHVRGLAEQAVEAEAARGRELASRLEEALKDSRAREETANARADELAAAASAESERRVRQLRLQLEQSRSAATARDREVSDALSQQRASERRAQESAHAEAAARQRIVELETQIEELQKVVSERDSLSAKVEHLAKLAEAQGVELRRLQDSKAKAKAAAAALRRQISTERQAHRTAAAHAAHQLRAQAEAAAFAADVRSRRGGWRGGDEAWDDAVHGRATRSPPTRVPGGHGTGGHGGAAPSPSFAAFSASLGIPPFGGSSSDGSDASEGGEWDLGGLEGTGAAASSSPWTASTSCGASTPSHMAQIRRGRGGAEPGVSMRTPTTAANASAVDGDGNLQEQSLALAAKLQREARSLSTLLKAGADGSRTAGGLDGDPLAEVVGELG
jgi:hypothetical protein